MPLKNLSKDLQPILRKRGQLVQVEIPSAPTAVYTLPVKRRVEIFRGEIMVVNRTNQNRWLTVWIDNTGALTGNPELIHFEIDVPSKSKMVSEIDIFLDNPGATISMESENANSLIVTIFGTEYINT